MAGSRQVSDLRFLEDGSTGLANVLSDALRTTNVPAVAAYNVKSFLAAGDGVTDDTIAIQNAINALGTQGGMVSFPPGTYLSGLLTLPSQVHLMGSGIEASVIKLKNGANSSLVQGQNFATLTGGNTTGGIFNWSIQNLTLDGNKANNTGTTNAVLQVYGFGYILSNVRIRNGAGDGIYSEWSTSGASPGVDSMEAQITNLKVHDCASNGVQWNGPHDSMWANGVVYNNGTTAGKGIWVRSAGNGLLCNNVHSWGLTQTYAWFLEGTGCGMFNCVGEGATTAQVFIGANDCWIGCSNIFAAGGATTGIVIGDGTHTNLAGIRVDAKVENCTTTSLSLAQDGGGNRFNITAFATSGSTFTGSLNINSHLEVVANGGATPGEMDVHCPVKIHDGNALWLFHSTDNSNAQINFDGTQVQSSWPANFATRIQIAGTASLFAGSGAPSGGTGSNGDFYFRTDGGVGTCIYQRRAGSWVATGA